MTILHEGFNPLAHNPEQMAPMLPVGQHVVIITGSEVKGTKDNTGGMLVLDLSIQSASAPQGSGGALRLNLYNASVKACEIAQQQLAAICYATQTFQLGADGRDITHLYNKPFGIDVQMQAESKYTEVKRILNADGTDVKASQAQQPQQTQQPVQQTSSGFGAAQQPANAGFGGQQQQPAATGFGGAPAGQQPATGFGQTQQPVQQQGGGFGQQTQGGQPAPTWGQRPAG